MLFPFAAFLHAWSDVLIQLLAQWGRGPADTKAVDDFARLHSIIGHRYLGRSGIMRVATGNNLQYERGISRVTREHSDLIQRRTKCDQAITRDSTVGRLHSDHSAERSGLTHRSAGI